MTNYKWLLDLFSGLGTTVLGAIFFNKWRDHKLFQKQKSGKNSINLQAGHNIEIKKAGISNE